jgi:hypothetical protein
MLMMHIFAIPFILFISLCQSLVGQTDAVGGIGFENTQVELNLNDATHPIEIIEYSNGLSEWVAVSRNYGNGWESIFPYSYTIEESNGEVPRLLLPQGEQGFFRKRFEPTVEGVSNY